MTDHHPSNLTVQPILQTPYPIFNSGLKSLAIRRWEAMEAVPCKIQGIRSCPLSLYSYSQSFLTDAMRLVKQDFSLVSVCWLFSIMLSVRWQDIISRVICSVTSLGKEGRPVSGLCKFFCLFVCFNLNNIIREWTKSIGLGLLTFQKGSHMKMKQLVKKSPAPKD